MNEQTNEFQFYEVTFKASKPGVIAAIDLTTPVRQSVPQTITLENPLHYAVNFQATCSVPEVLMPNQLAVPAQSEVNARQVNTFMTGDILDFGSTLLNAPL